MLLLLFFNTFVVGAIAIGIIKGIFGNTVLGRFFTLFLGVPIAIGYLVLVYNLPSITSTADTFFIIVLFGPTVLGIISIILCYIFGGFSDNNKK